MSSSTRRSSFSCFLWIFPGFLSSWVSELLFLSLLLLPGFAFASDLDGARRRLYQRIEQEKTPTPESEARPTPIASLNEKIKQEIDRMNEPQRGPPGLPDIWGQAIIQLTPERAYEGDLQELERGFTWPTALSLSALDFHHALEGTGLASLRLRDPTGEDHGLDVTAVTQDDLKARVRIDRSRFRDLPAADRTVRSQTRGHVEWRRDADLELPFLLTLTDARFHLDIEDRRMSGGGPLGPRDWTYESYEVGTQLDLGPVRLELELPFSHYHDAIDPVDSNTHGGFRLRGSGRFFGSFRGSGGIQYYELGNGTRDRNESLLVVDVNMKSNRVYGIRGLENRTRMSLVRRSDEFALTGRVKNYYEGSSRMIYHRIPNILVEMGSDVRRTNHRRLTRSGILSVPAFITPEERLRLDFETFETRPIRSRGWTSVTARAPTGGFEARFRTEGTLMSRPPLTSLVAEDSPTLYYTQGSSVVGEVRYDSDSPLWGMTLRLASSARENEQRGTEWTVSEPSLIFHYLPHPRMTLTGMVHQQDTETNVPAAAADLTNATTLSGSAHYVAGPLTAFFADLTLTAATGLLSATENVFNVGLEGVFDPRRRDSWKLTLTRAKLNSGTDRLESHIANMVTGTYSLRF